jgi:hypothetical protein
VYRPGASVGESGLVAFPPAKGDVRFVLVQGGSRRRGVEGREVKWEIVVWQCRHCLEWRNGAIKIEIAR